MCSSGYPDGHTDRDTDEDGEIVHLKAKVDAGADFIVTQLFYDVDGFLKWMKKIRQKGQRAQTLLYDVFLTHSGINVPVIPGIMPIQTYSSFLRLTKLCGTRVPPSLVSALEPICVSRNI
jgi:methylenetetrahydrofolate reductase (NADPH)